MGMKRTSKRVKGETPKQASPFICLLLLNNLVSRGTFVEHNCNTMEEKKKISKKSGILMAIDLLYKGLSRQEILQEFSKICKLSNRTVDDWIKEARPAVQERLEEDERIRRRESEAIISEAVKEHGVTKEKLVARLAKIALGEAKDLFTVDGGLKPVSEWGENSAMIAGIESFDERMRETGEVLGTVRKIKIWNPIDASALLCKMLGYNMPDKVAATDGKGNDIPQQVVIFKLPDNGRGPNNPA